jgi:hypothetical protein
VLRAVRVVPSDRRATSEIAESSPIDVSMEAALELEELKHKAIALMR